MNEIAERGFAAHWKYKEGKFGTENRENVEWVNRLLEWHKDNALRCDALSNGYADDATPHTRT